ncbi:MAG: YnfA family protein [Chloroflexota bacterium]
MLQTLAEFSKTLGLFIVAAICEIGGAYLIWQWQRSGKSIVIAAIGLTALFLYSVIQTAQSFGFGRTFAAYGAIFICTALLWGWLFDKQVPDQWDVLGGGVCLAGALIILVTPRT